MGFLLTVIIIVFFIVVGIGIRAAAYEDAEKEAQYWEKLD